MKTESLVMTIDFGKNHFNAIYLNNKLSLIASNGRMIFVNNIILAGPHEESADLQTKQFDGEKREMVKQLQ